jgi:hypothetical protein
MELLKTKSFAIASLSLVYEFRVPKDTTHSEKNEKILTGAKPLLG